MCTGCKDCPQYPRTIGAMLERAAALDNGEAIVELSIVGKRWTDPAMERGAEAIIFHGDDEVSARATTAIAAIDEALTKAQEATT